MKFNPKENRSGIFLAILIIALSLSHLYLGKDILYFEEFECIKMIMNFSKETIVIHLHIDNLGEKKKNAKTIAFASNQISECADKITKN